MKRINVSITELVVGQDVTVWDTRNGWGQGGIVREVGPTGSLVIVDPIGNEHSFDVHIDDIAFEVEVPYEADECLDFGPECSGPVENRWTGTSQGYQRPRCQHHGDLHEARGRRISGDYPDSPIAPSWFDPEYAGERWDDDY